MTGAIQMTVDPDTSSPRTQVSWVASRNQAIVQSLMAQKVGHVLQTGGRVIDIVLHDPDTAGVSWGWVAHTGGTTDGGHDDRCAGDPPGI